VDDKDHKVAYLHSLVPNLNLEWVYNPTHGKILDPCEAVFLNYFGFSSTAEQLVDKWTRFHEDNEDRPHAKYLQICHSKGAMDVIIGLERVPKEIRDRVIVVAIAPGEVVPRELCYQSFNYASEKDLVHGGKIALALALQALTIPLNGNGKGVSSEFLEIAIKNHEQLILLKPHPNAQGLDHEFESPTYENVLRFHLKNHTNCNGEYKSEITVISNN
jgi:hypothetical protein